MNTHSNRGMKLLMLASTLLISVVIAGSRTNREIVSSFLDVRQVIDSSYEIRKHVRRELLGLLVEEDFIVSGETVYEWDDSKWAEPRYKSVFMHDSVGMIKEYLGQYKIGKEWIDSTRSIEITDENGRWTQELIQLRSGGNFVPSLKKLLVYDQRGNLTEEEHLKMVSGVWVDRSKHSFQYDRLGRKIQWIPQDWEANKWKTHSHINFEYDEYGRLAKRIDTVYQRQGPPQVHSTTFSYDEQGRLSLVLKSVAESKNISKDRIIYDDVHGNIERIFQVWGGRSWMNVWRTTSSSDTYGNTVKAIRQKWNSVNNTWQNHIKQVYVYERLGIAAPPAKIVVPVTSAKRFHLSHNYPNPFNATTQIQYTVPEEGFVSMKIYDMLGREVAVLVNEIKVTGDYTVSWDGDGLSSGVYFYRMVFGDQVETKKMNLIK